MKRWTIVILALVAAFLLVWAAVLQAPDGRLHVVFLDVSAGQAVLVTTPSGRAALIDGGPEPSVLLTALGRYLPFWQRNIDAVIATHAGQAAVAALHDVCRRYSVAAVIIPPPGDRPTAAYRQWRDLLQQQDLRREDARPGLRLDMGDDVVIEIVTVAQDQAAIRVVHHETDVLLAGRLSEIAPATASVVALPERGLAAARGLLDPAPAAVIVFDGRQGTMADTSRWDGVEILRTSIYGAIEMVSDGRTVTLRPVH
jgi:beta-lactamase superfamily II metal-dependent hydrolase